MATYSEPERLLFTYFDVMDLLDKVPTITIYTLMVEKAFLMNDQTGNSDALRRCIKALREGRINRLTQEWDNLICPYKE